MRRAAALLVLCAVLSGGCSKKSGHPRSELDGGEVASASAALSSSLRTRASELASTDEATWREARLFIALSGAAGLDALTVALGSGAPPSRVESTLSRLLQSGVDWSAVESRPWLRVLGEEKVRQAFELADTIPRGDTEVKSCPMVPEGRQKTPKGEQVMQSLDDMGGFALPAAVRLLSAKEPLLRAYGVRIIGGVGASSFASVVEPLTHDDGSWKVFDCDVVFPRTVSTEAKAVLEGWHRDGDKPLYGFERMARFEDADLMNAARSFPAAWEAKTFEEYFDVVRPVFREYWAEAAGADRVKDRERFLRAVNAMHGFSFEHVETPGVNRMTVDAPSGSTVELRDESKKLLASGSAPLDFRPTSPTHTMEVKVVRPDGGVFDEGFFCCDGMTFRLHLR